MTSPFLSRKNINVKRSNPILMILQKGNERLGAISVGQDERSNGTTYCKDKMLNKLTFFLLQVLNNFANEQ